MFLSPQLVVCMTKIIDMEFIQNIFVVCAQLWLVYCLHAAACYILNVASGFPSKLNELVSWFKGSVTEAVCVCTVPHVPCLLRYCQGAGNIFPTCRLAAERAVWCR